MGNEELLTKIQSIVTDAVAQSEARMAKQIGEVEANLTHRIDAQVEGVHDRITHMEAHLAQMATKDDLSTLDEKLDRIQEAIADVVQADEARLDDHERRIGRLERRAA